MTFPQYGAKNLSLASTHYPLEELTICLVRGILRSYQSGFYTHGSTVYLALLVPFADRG